MMLDLAFFDVLHLSHAIADPSSNHMLVASKTPAICFNNDGEAVSCSNETHTAMHCYDGDRDPMPCKGSDEHALGIKCFDHQGNAHECTNEDGNVAHSFDFDGNETRTAHATSAQNADYCYNSSGNPTSCSSCSVDDIYTYTNHAGKEVTTATCGDTPAKLPGLLQTQQEMAAPLAPAGECLVEHSEYKVYTDDWFRTLLCAEQSDAADQVF